MEIIIKGPAKCGKSTMAQEIAAALRHCGFPVNYDDDDKPRSREQQMDRLGKLRDELNDASSSISVSVVNTARGG